MKLSFSQEDIDNNKHILEIEDIKIFGQHIEVHEDYYTLLGKAEIDGEIYTDFIVEFSLTENPKENTIDAILAIDWNEYDFVF